MLKARTIRSTLVQAPGARHIVVTCFHCNEAIPAQVQIYARIDNSDEAVCCFGCRAVAELIAGAGLQDYYRFRETPAPRVEDDLNSEWRTYDRPELLAQLTHAENDGTRVATLVLDGMGCAACGWLIERMLKRERDVCACNVNVATGRVRVQWRPEELLFSHILQTIAALGYRPHPIGVNAVATHARDERRAALKRLAVAGFGMMQVTMFAVAFYASELGEQAQAMEPQVRLYLRYVSLLCATPVLFYAGWPFLSNAWQAVRARAVTMDVPVSIGLLLAYSASVWNTARNTGDVYFDSVAMFVFFLTLGRFVEMTARHRSGDVTDALARLLPLTAHRVRARSDGGEQTDEVSVASLAVNDIVVVRTGETVPTDGCVIEGTSRIDESMLTGESMPVLRGVGETLLAGALNLHAPLRIRVTAIGQATVLLGIVRLMQRAEHAPQATAADRAAAWFLRRILIGAVLVAAAWLIVDPSRAFAATLAVLVVTCPCALSLATPVALAAATAALAKRGALITHSAALETLAKITRVVFDKTGTLTHGQPIIESCQVLAAVPHEKCRRIAFALEQGSEHPIARAFRFSEGSPYVAADVQVTPGGGIEGAVDGERYRIGRKEYARATVGDDADIFLSNATQTLASFRLGDRLRNEAPQVIAALRARQLPSEILSGDAWVAVAHTAQACGIEQYTARQSPAGKLEYVRELSQRGEIVAMIGDGINDAPVLKGAAVSIAMGHASALAQVSADIVLLGDTLTALPPMIDLARRTQRIVKQNLVWAATYNLVALPLAAFGFVPPWLAAIGMSMSSIVVVLNALRLSPVSRYATRAARSTPPILASSQ